MKKLTFPRDFMFGAAAAACQYEGAFDQDKKGLSVADFKIFDPNADNTKIDPDSLELYQDNFKEMTNKDLDKIFPYRWGIDFYNQYQEDIKLFKQVGMNCFRTSLSWSRIVPDDGVINYEAIKHYKKIFSEFKKNNIKLVLTLSHSDHPLWLVEKYNGFESKIAIDKFLEYAKIALTEFKDYVECWLGFNEINLASLSGYTGSGMLLKRDDQKNQQLRFIGLTNQFIAQAKLVKLAHEIDKSIKVGCMVASVLSYPATCKPNDVLANQQYQQINNHFYYEVMCNGEFPSYMQSYFDKHKISITLTNEEKIILKENTVDFVAFSYYMTSIMGEEAIEKSGGNLFFGGKNPYLKASEWGWQIDPVGLRILMNDLYYKFKKPLMIVENGIGVKETWDENLNMLDDNYRIDYLKNHLKNLLWAIEDGVECIGYTAWTAIDLVSASTREMKKRYGLIYVDQDDFGQGSKTRKIKESGKWFKTIADSNGSKLWD